MESLRITSNKNPRIRRLMQLQKPRVRRESGSILIEGDREIRAALEGNVRIKAVYHCPESNKEETLLREISGIFAQAEIIGISGEVFSKLAYRENTSGLIAEAEQPQHALVDIRPGENPLIVVLEHVEKPGNMGAILRTADAAGVDAVLFCDSQTDLFNPNVIRSSLGCVFTVPTAACSSADAAEWLKNHQIPVFATSLKASKPYTECNMSGPTAILMGAEDRGISEFWVKNAEQSMIIPMLGKADSMNVSVSTAIVLFEALRQRKRHSIRN
jgi:RNA methyltransferase, TrmH family